MRIKYHTLCKWLIAIFFLLNLTISYAQAYKADLVIGDWQDSKRQTLIRCFKLNGKYYAKAVWIENLKSIGE